MSESEGITLEQVQQLVDNWIKRYGVRYFSELTNMACLTEEVGELARVMARAYGDQSFKPGEKANLADEMADILWVLTCLANQTGVNLTEAFRNNMEKKTQRDNKRHISNPKLISNTMTELHNHEHHDHDAQLKSKYEQALSKYNVDIDDAEVAAAVKKIVEEKVPENDNDEVKRFLFGSIELTTLTTQDSDESVLRLVERVNQFDHDYPYMPHVATICTYPRFAKLVSQSLEVDGVHPICVSGAFPSSQAMLEVKVAETALAVRDGAEEIDIVMHVGAFLCGDYETVCDEIQEQKAACGDVPMKVILETGDLLNASNIKKASILSMYAGADYIKTSTGKEKVSATPEAAYVMCQAIKEYYDETGIQVGFKPAGGINTVHDALTYYTIVKEVLGQQWLTNKWFRMGTSRLTNLLLSELEGKEVKYF